MNKNARILEIFIRLMNGEKIRKRNIALEYNISVRTVERYINIISDVIDKRNNGKELSQNSIGEFMIVTHEQNNN